MVPEIPPWSRFLFFFFSLKKFLRNQWKDPSSSWTSMSKARRVYFFLSMVGQSRLLDRHDQKSLDLRSRKYNSCNGGPRSSWSLSIGFFFNPLSKESTGVHLCEFRYTCLYLNGKSTNERSSNTLKTSPFWLYRLK